MQENTRIRALQNESKNSSHDWIGDEKQFEEEKMTTQIT